MDAGFVTIDTSMAGTLDPLVAPPSLPRFPAAPSELRALVHSGESGADACERVLTQAARVQAALDVAIGDGLASLMIGDRLISLGFSNLRDYAREVLDLEERTAQAMARLSRDLRTRPLLRAALVASEVGLRAAQTIAPVAVGDAEAYWVERATRETVRALEAAVRKARSGCAEDEGWTRFGVRLSDEDRAALDEALAIGGKLLPGSTRVQRLEAMAQEYLGEHPVEAGDDGGGDAGGSFSAGPPRREVLAARLEQETERWSFLEPPLDVRMPDLDFDGLTSSRDIDARLREISAARASWDVLFGFCAYMVHSSGLWRIADFASFRQYCEERLGLSHRSVEQRAQLERRICQVPALWAAREAGLSYERLRLLSRLPTHELEEWIPRARQLTCVALREALDGRADRQMRAARVLRARVPDRVALLLQGAFRAVREVEGVMLDDGRCLVRVARHFIETWKPLVRRSRTLSQKVRDRDLGRCQVPGCSRRAVHAHHVVPRGRGGGDEPANLVALCACHHLRGIHGGYLRVSGTAPDGLVWELVDGGEWLGRLRSAA